MTALLVIAHILAAVLAHWSFTATWSGWFQMRVDLAFYRLQLWRLVSGNFFFTGDLWEVVWLVLFLALFGLPLERRLTGKELLWFYLLSGAGCCLVWGVSAIAWAERLVLQTSGAITSVIVLLLLLEPSHRFSMFKTLKVPAWALGILYYGVELRFYAWDSWTLALPVHLGGVICALLYRQFDLSWSRFSKREPLADPVPEAPEPTQWTDIRVHLPKAKEPQEVEDLPIDSQSLDLEVDQVLAKISRAGCDSLTEQEKQVLKLASERYRKRRL